MFWEWLSLAITGEGRDQCLSEVVREPLHEWRKSKNNRMDITGLFLPSHLAPWNNNSETNISWTKCLGGKPWLSSLTSSCLNNPVYYSSTWLVTSPQVYVSVSISIPGESLMPDNFPEFLSLYPRTPTSYSLSQIIGHRFFFFIDRWMLLHSAQEIFPTPEVDAKMGRGLTGFADIFLS